VSSCHSEWATTLRALRDHYDRHLFSLKISETLSSNLASRLSAFRRLHASAPGIIRTGALRAFVLAILLPAGVGLAATSVSANDQVRIRLARSPATAQPSRWKGVLDLRALPAGTKPTELLLDVQKRPGVSSPVFVSLMINGALLARSEIRGPTGTIRITLKDRQLSLQNQLDVALEQACGSCFPGADFATIKPLRVILRQASPDAHHFYELATLLRSGVEIIASPSDAAFARRALTGLAPVAPLRKDGGYEIEVSEFPPEGTAPWLRFDQGAVRLVTRNALVLYTQEQLNRMTIVQIVSRGSEPVLWIKPGRDRAMPRLMPLDYGNVAIFNSKGAEIAFSTSDDRIVQAEYRNQEAEASAIFETWRSFVLAVWVALTIGAAILMFRLPRLRTREA